ncbi:peptidoglycan DD-metalloendopeptidase family protein [Salinispora arenicola]|uniref:peptidoglycan DD-metalloendopeptidase family protein n=1 Tax=Salinispora arenicola TaxID=168697 RepID=UPI0003AA2E4F|nr:peptidoglycan DD-metalloendopeptidase family protein [Salinispora arenicola]
MPTNGPARTAVTALAVMVLIPLVMLTSFVSIDSDNDGRDDAAMALPLVGGALRSDAPIPNPAWVPWLNRAATTCQDITPALLAAQIDTESSWNPNARADNPPSRGGAAMGLAQFQQATWDTWGSDADGDGVSSPFDPQDAIMAMAALMCDHLSWARAGIGDGALHGDPLDIALAAYNCGRGCVASAGGVPASGQAHHYPQRVRSRIPTYAATPVAVAGGWTLPLPENRYAVGSGFGPRGGRLHAGVDLMAAKEVPIVAASAGRVIVVKCNSSIGCAGDGGVTVTGCGWYVDVRHAGGVVTRYCHMIRLPLVRVGQQVSVGQQIGSVGSTGGSSGPHLHFEVHTNVPDGGFASPSNAIDPITFLRSAGLNP